MPLACTDLAIAYDQQIVARDLSLSFTRGTITAIIGPNGCGKSSLLRACARLVRPRGGAVLMDGQDIASLSTRAIAQRVGLHAQQHDPMIGVTVEDLVVRGRYPHQQFMRLPTRSDIEHVDDALALTGLSELRRHPLDELSGGQRQRAWLAMAIAQDPEVLLLDEPTTFLDLAHQVALLDVIARLRDERGKTIVTVLHDLNDAARIADHIIAMKDGKVVRSGAPVEVLEPALLGSMFDIPFDVLRHPSRGQAVCIPRLRQVACPERCPLAAAHHRITLDRVSVAYGDRAVLDRITTEIPEGRVSVVIGPNACGKSTLLKGCASLLKPAAGTISVGGRDTRRQSARSLAHNLSLLTQEASAPVSLRVDELVGFGRTPHQRPWRRWSSADEQAVHRALDRTNLSGLRARPVNTLSGGQRQRARIAMALAQETPALLLDEPTTFLDLGAQIDLLDLIRDINRKEGRTVGMVLHDLNLAAHYADWLIVVKDGRVAKQGVPEDVLTPHTIQSIFGVETMKVEVPSAGAAAFYVPT